MVKPLGKQLKGISAYSGATIMGDGRVALILDIDTFVARTNHSGASSDPLFAAAG